MAKMFGIEIKAVKEWMGEEGLTRQGNLYIDGKKVGFFSEDPWGGDATFDFEEHKIEKEFDKRVKRYFKKYPIDRDLSFTKTDTDGNLIKTKTIDSSIYETNDQFMYELLKLVDYQKEYKKGVKASRPNLLVFETNAPINYSKPIPLNSIYTIGGTKADELIEQTIKEETKKFEYYKVRVFKSAEDFEIS